MESADTVWAIYKRHGINRLRYKKRWRRYPQRYCKDKPGDREWLMGKEILGEDFCHRKTGSL
jgi:hypothetical protein